MTGNVLKQRFLLCCAVTLLAGWVLAPAAPATPPNAGSAVGEGCSPDLEHRLDLTLDEALALAEDRSLHITVDDNGGDGPIVIGVGKLSPRSPDDPRGRGFQYCRMGTGYNSDWEITGEKYCFGPGESVFFGGHYEDVCSGHCCGDGWYRPDGSLYWENQCHHYIEDPPGGECWEWYNVVFWYDPMPSSMQQYEGSWTARWWDDYSNVCNQNYTVMYDLVNHLTCHGITGDSDPLNPTNTFYVTDDRIYAWLQCDDFTLNFTDDFKWRWFGPDGFYTEIIVDAENPGGGNCFTWCKAWSWIYVAGYYPAEHPGTWYVEGYIKDYSGTWEHKYTDNFTIQCVSPGPSIIQQPDPPSATICEGQSQHWCVVAEGTGTLSYQWQNNDGSGWQDISGATSSCYDATQAGSYRCVVSDACGSTNSNSAFLNVRTGPNITQQPEPPLAVVCEGDSQTWCIQASGSAPLEYQWQRNTGSGWQDIAGENEVCREATIAGSYRCAVWNDCGGPIYSDTVTLSVMTEPTIVQQPTPPSASVCEGTAQQWCVGVSGSEPIGYQWQRNTGGGWNDIPGANTDCYDALIEGSYRCVVWNDCGGPLYSDVVALTVDTAPSIVPIADHETPPYEPYSYAPSTGPGTTPADSWALVSGPDQMSVDPLTGEVTWPYPEPPESVHEITIAATNGCGTTQEGWVLTVTEIPAFTIGGQIYTDLGNPLFSGLDGVTVDVVGELGTYSAVTETMGVPGIWMIEGVLAGDYTVTPSLAGYCFIHVIDGEPGEAPPITITVSAENEAENQSIQFWAEAMTNCLGDLDGDNDIDLADLAELLGQYGEPGPWEYEDGDLDCDGDVDLADLATLLGAYGDICE